MGVFNQSSHVLGCLEVIHPLLKSLLKLVQRDRFEAREPRVEHQLSQCDDLLKVFSYRKETLDNTRHEELIGFSLWITSKDINELLGELEVS